MDEIQPFLVWTNRSNKNERVAQMAVLYFARNSISSSNFFQYNPSTYGGLKKTRLIAEVIQQKMATSRLAVPNIMRCHVNCSCSGGGGGGTNEVNLLEQNSVPTLLKDRISLGDEIKPRVFGFTEHSYKTLIKIWNKLSKDLVPN